MIDKSKIKAGDKIKVRFTLYGISTVSEDWIEAKSKVYDGYGRTDRVIGSLNLNDSSIKVTEHKPGFADLECAVENAVKNLRDAEKDLAKARSDSNIMDIGTLVRYINSFGNVDNEGEIVHITETDYQVKFDRWGTHWYKHEDIERL